MAKINSPLTTVLEAQLVESDSSQFEVGEQRERNHRYYALQPIGNEQRGKSHYISPDVLDSVEGKKALFKETFCTGRQVVKFSAVPGQPHEGDAKTAYAELMLRRNNKEKLFRDGWHDAFVAKRMAVWTSWMPDTKTVDINVNGSTQQQVMMLIAQYQSQGEILGVKESNLEQFNGLWYGSVEVELDDSYVDLELMQPERYYRDPNASYPDDAMWNTYEEDLSKGALVAKGYDRDQVEGLNMDYRWRSEEEDSARKAHDRSWTRRRQHKRQQEQETVTHYRTRTWLNLVEHDPQLAQQLGVTEEYIGLWEIHWSQGEILFWQDGTPAVREIDHCGVFEWTEYKVAHAEHGMADADIMSHTQKTQSTLKRLIIDNQQMRNTSRYEAQMGALKNPRDLLDNRIGGVVWSRRIGSVQPLATPELSPLTMNVIAMLSADGDKRSGLTDLAKGMNDDAVRVQNSEGKIDKLTKAGNRRVMAAARDWAQTFLVPLCQHIVTLGMENDRSQRQLEMGGRMIPIVPMQWTDTEVQMAVAEALTPEEGQRLAQGLLMLHSVKIQDPDMAAIYSVQQKHALFDRVYDALGIEDSTPFMMRPDSPEFMQKMQMQQQQLQVQQQKQEQLQMLQIGLMQSADRREWEKFNWDVTNDMADNLREDRELDHTIEYDNDKLQVERQSSRLTG